MSGDNYKKYLKDATFEPISDKVSAAIVERLEEHVKEYWSHVAKII